MRVAGKIELTSDIERQLQALSNLESAGRWTQRRASAILLAAQGWQNKDIALEVQLDKGQVGFWRRRFIAGGVEALKKAPARLPRPLSLAAKSESLILSATFNERPTSATQWSTRTLATHLGLKAATIERVWRRNGLKPHLQRAFELAPEARVASDKVKVVGLFLHPAKKAIAFSCDEKGLGRKTTCKESGLPLLRGRALTMANYYKRNGTLPVFSALNELADSPTPVQPHPPLADWLNFLDLIERETPRELRLYLIEDCSFNPRLGHLQSWLLSNTRLVLHVTPTRKAWIRVFELFYRDLFGHRTGGVLGALERAVKRYVTDGDRSAGTVVWTPKDVIETKPSSDGGWPR